jgi:hypothetical protein
MSALVMRNLATTGWALAAAVLTVALALAGPSLSQAASDPYQVEAVPIAQCQIDRLVFNRLREIGIQPSRLCSDAVFIRRAYLDIIGTVPAAEDVQAFLRSPDPSRRAVLIDRLLQREEFADYWAMKWCDVLRVKGEFPINLWPKAAQAYHRWIRTCIRENRPYDRFVREMLLATGSNFYVAPANFYRAMESKRPQAIAQAVALTFMGVRAEKWPKERLAGMAAFFEPVSYKPTGEWKEEIVYLDPAKLVAGAAVFPDGSPARVMAGQDQRETFANWLLSPGNPWFARAAVNRLWYWLLGRGIIHEPDDIRPDNVPQNAPLLAYLEREFIASHYDLKHVCRLILNSRTYQLSAIPRDSNPDAPANFACYPIRPLEAEVLADVLCQITGTSEKYSSPVPEPFTFVPEEEGTVETANGNTSSAFLELFGRPARDTGLAVERNLTPSPGQRLHLLNSSHVQRKIEQSTILRSLASAKTSPREAVDAVYLAVLSRLPTEDERKTVAAYAAAGGLNPRDAAMDLVWALINSEEFLYRH